MRLREAVEKYLALAGRYGTPVALSAFGLSPKETEYVFGAFDEDYHISRFFHFSSAEGQSYPINGFPQTHVTIDPGIADEL